METKRIPLRADIPVSDTWNLGDIYADGEAWEAAFEKLSAQKDVLESTFRGKLGEGRDTVHEALQMFFAQLEQLQTLYTYAGLYKAQDNGDADAQGMEERVAGFAAAWSASVSFFQPELLTLPKDVLSAYIDDEAFSAYNVFLEDILREAPHTLDAAQERMLSMAGEVFSAQDNVFEMLSYVDLKFPDIEDDAGHPLPLSEGTYVDYLRAGSRKIRQQAFQTLLNTYGQYRNTLAATYATSVKRDVFSARVRHFESARARALFPDRVPEQVYDGLVQTVHDFLPQLHRYVALRKPILKLDSIHLYDLYVSMVDDFDLDLPFAQAYDLVVESLTCLGESYQQDLRHAKAARWIDVFENQGKTTGAFSNGGAYGVHPYVMLNFSPTLEETLTVAHEMGHAMHSYYSNRAQPFAKADYTIFAAEVASTVNEILLLDSLLEKYPAPSAQAALLGHLLEGFRTTVFRQTMFAEFEHKTHRMAEQGVPLTADALEAEYLALNQRYYGGAAHVDCEIAHEWSRIPHFYGAFYVYKYATGFTAAVALTKRLREGGPQALSDYLRFLSLGGSLPPIEALKLAGVDMSTQAPVQSALSYFEEILGRFEALKCGHEGL